MPIFKNFKTQIKKLSKSRDHADIPDHVLDQALDIASKSLVKLKTNESKVMIVPSEKKGTDDKHDQTLMVVVTDDRPFLIDSITAACVEKQYTIEGVLHNTLIAERTGSGQLKSICAKTKKDQEGHRESFLIVTLQGILGKEQKTKFEKEISEVITDVRFATQDWEEMRQAVCQSIEDLSNVKKANDKSLFDEYQALLNYVHENNFTLLGFREYKFLSKKGEVKSQIVKGSGLGLLSDTKRPVYINKTRQSLPAELQKTRKNQATLTISKVNKRATVHRRVPMDAIAVKTYDDKGNIVGEKLFIGLFTSVTYSRSIQDIPYLRMKVQQVLNKTGYGENSHNYRALMHILEKYPRDELFQIDVETLTKYAVSIMALQEQPKVALYVREDPFKRYVSCLVYVPREKYETDLRMKVQDILETEFDGHCEAFHTVLDDSPLARVIYRVNIDESKKSKKYNLKAIEKRLVEATRSWEERIRTTLLDKCESEKSALSLAKKYKKSFPVGYQVQAEAVEAYHDIQKLEQVEANNEFMVDLYHNENHEKHQLNLKVYHPNTPIILSDILPVLENFGFNVMAEKPFEIKMIDGKSTWLHDFEIEFKNPNHAKPVKEIKDVFEDGLRAIWNKDCENDKLNSLIAKAKMPWRDVLILRAMVKYMRQTKIQYTPTYMMQAVTDNPDIADMMLEYFYGRHKPVHSKDKCKSLMSTNKRKINKALEKVSSFDQDRILRSMLQIMEATLRTNFFQNKSYVSFKIDSANVDILPLPRPMVEIFVYSPRVEGIHLRGGKVARGGLRWSDRHEDFRTEVLGLMKAQNVKNAVIIPVGSKGGFVVKNSPKTGGRDAFMAEGIECYKTFISGLLDITDNINGAKIVPPTDVVRHDEDDPYLVVAADKGTATFSDIANGLAMERRFWLGDAFASGGSAGYDHKVMGITARGAWESVKRHFRELGKNIQKEEFEVVGVGDMGGDVFGNGMLLSPCIRLVGAFNHLHIFCDPNPDVKSSFKERQRLFKAVKGWDQYDEKLLSKGGRIYSRQDKSLKLTSEIQARFGLDKKEVSPLELMNAMLKSEVDLMWFGGIGTYIKAPNESHADAGDKANDNIRIDAHEVRAKVIGEGANLGTTHAARICMNLLGVKCYADFIDNAGGVNSSDLEVNIKILFQQIMQKSKLTVKERNKVLTKMTKDVEDLVLRNNYQQTQAISMAHNDAYAKLTTHTALIEHLEKTFGLDRAIEYLPDATSLENRARDHKGLTAPELSTLISYTKIKLFQDLVDSNLPNDPAFQDWMTHYFPDELRKKYTKEMKEHRLRREIISTQMANSIVNRMGPTYVMNQSLKTGAPACTIARIYFIVREIFDLRDTYSEIEALDNVATAQAQIEALDSIASFIDYGSTWFLKHYRAENLKEKELLKTGDTFKKDLSKLMRSFDKLLPDTTRSYVEKLESHYISQNFPKDVAHKLALLPILNTVWDVIRISKEQDQDLKTVAKVYYGLNKALSFVWLRDKAKTMEPETRWEAETLKSVADRLYVTQAQLTKRIVREVCSGKKCPTNPVQDWIELNQDNVQPILDLVETMNEEQKIDFAMLTSVESRFSQLV